MLVARQARRVLVVLAVLFAVHAIRFYGSTIFNFIHADLVVTALLGAKCAAAKLPIVGDWYYVNGDVWFLGPHLVGALVVPAIGTTPHAVAITNAISFAIELALLVWALGKVSSSKVTAWTGAIVTLFPWSFIHLLFVWVELSYGWLVSLYVPFFVLTARLVDVEREEPRNAGKERRLAIAVGVFCFGLVLQNPMRGLVFTIFPVAVAIALQRQRDMRRRLFVLGVVASGWFAAFLIHRFVFLRVLTFSPNGGTSFVLQKDLSGILTNLQRIGSGLVALAQPRSDLSNALAILGLLILAGAFAFTCQTAFAGSGKLRFLALAFLAQLAMVAMLLVFGNLVGDDKSIRYFLPGILGCYAVGSVAAIEGAKKKKLETSVAQIWLVLLPIVGFLAISRRFIGPREVFSEADPAQLEVVAKELERRNLTHGFATPWNANTLTVLSSGRTQTCGVTFAGDYGLVPQKWLVGTECFDRTKLPASIYFIAHSKDEIENRRKAIAASRANQEALLEEEEHFTISGDFDIVTYKTSEISLDWLARP